MPILHCVGSSGETIVIRPGEKSMGFQEGQTYKFFDIPAASRLFIDEVLIEPAAEGATLVYRWEPGFFAGEVMAELMDLSDRLLGQYYFDVSPDGEKVGREVFEEMLGELFAFDPRLILGRGDTRTTVGNNGEITTLDLQYARLRMFGGPLVSALEAVSQRPLSRLRYERERVGLHEARRLDQRSVQLALREPLTSNAIHGGVNKSCGLGKPYFDVKSTITHWDTPANRQLFATLLSVMRRTSRVGELVGEVAMETSTEAGPYMALRLHRRSNYLKQLVLSLKRLRKSFPFSSVTRGEVSAAGLNAVSSHPAYANAYRFGWYILRPGIAGDVREEPLWLNPTWEIYERWAFLQVFRTLKGIFPDIEWTRSFPSTRVDCIRFSGNDGTAEVSIWLQVYCPAWDCGPSREGFRSISGERYPDIAITLKSPDRARFIILDAKYRVSRPAVLDGMASAHLYRDCLRWNDLSPIAALLLVPRAGGAPWLETNAFQEQHHVGVVPLGHAQDLETLTSALTRLLN